MPFTKKASYLVCKKNGEIDPRKLFLRMIGKKKETLWGIEYIMSSLLGCIPYEVHIFLRMLMSSLLF